MLDTERPDPQAWARLLELHGGHIARVTAIDPLVNLPVPGHRGEPVGRVLLGDAIAAWASVRTSDLLWTPNRDHVLVARAARVDQGAWGAIVDEWLALLHDDPLATDAETAASLWVASRDRALMTQLATRHFAPVAVHAAKRLHAEPTIEPPAGVTIRTATPTDVDWLADGATAVHEWDQAYGFVPPRPQARDVNIKELAAALAEDDPPIWIAERGSEPIGFVHVLPPEWSEWATSMVTVEPAAYLATGYVSPAERSGGIGRALASAAHADALRRGWHALVLTYAIANAWSSPMWSSLGYRPVVTTWARRPALR